MPSLQRLLKRCDSHLESSLESEAMLLRQLGWQGGEDDDVPVATLERLACGDNSDGYWFCADPIHLHEDKRYLIMGYPSALDLELEQAQALAASINQHFAEDGWRLEVVTPQRWYLRLDKDPGVHTTPYWRTVGRDIFGLMPDGKNKQQWHAWLMELQMLLFSHPVNEARVEQGELPVSGLWLWGGGRLPELASKTFVLRGNNLLMQGIARHSGCEIKALPVDLSAICDDIEQDTGQLILQEQARTALQSGNMEQGKVALKKMEKELFRPLVDLLKSGKINSLTIIDTPGEFVTISARGIRKWWRRKFSGSDPGLLKPD